MTVESWIAPEETAALAAVATAMIDANLRAGPDGMERAAFWAAVRKGYNTPYNDPPPRKRPASAAVATVAVPATVVTAAVPDAMPPEVIALAAAAALGEIRTA